MNALRLVEVANELKRLQRDLATMRERERLLRIERGRLIRSLIDQHGWKPIAAMLGIGHTRLYAMRQRTPLTGFIRLGKGAGTYLAEDDDERQP
jgi:hypothetical protein